MFAFCATKLAKTSSQASIFAKASRFLGYNNIYIYYSKSFTSDCTMALTSEWSDLRNLPRYC